MIICLYHGSTFKEVNEKQTQLVTKKISKYFKDEVVEECYYSKHVHKVMERRNTPISKFEDILTNAVKLNENIYILIINMIHGKEYENILNTVKSLDKKGHVKLTEPILSTKYIKDVAKSIEDTRGNVIYVGHGTSYENDSYKELQNLLIQKDNYVYTLNDDFKLFLKKVNKENKIILKPLMFTSAYHSKKDINKTLKGICIDEGYNVEIELTPLCKNQKIINLLINNLENIMCNSCE